ncbi:cytochrome-c peroxidase [Sinisalibacter aestuarii]|uniref:Methylamine utilization protein MauG n=1 Tax=Sinisalibacter aestuarii TaxID=2949426 RepID=A0ABQ5LMV7_9RHOB|nr:cytochrome c peroxidase [Sinisalibacter aestuarii]GKY86360.1 methylamine utilization protein MauG [Sinisalibacter aestuarii]
MRILLALALMTAAAQAADLPAPVTDADYMETTPEAVALGQLLFYDPILSGSKTVACSTCHHPRFGTSDGLSLGLGDGADGLGPDRVALPENLPEKRIPRNAPGMFNLGALQFTHMFHAGRLEADPTKPGGIRTPLGQEMVAGFSGVLSAQAMFPVLSADEMAGHYSENEISQAVRQGFLTGEGGAWDLISKRVEAVPEYREMFTAVIGPRPIDFTDISNVVAEFIAFEWRSDDSPFDRHLRGTEPLSGDALAGMELFYGKAGCADCHAGPFQTDHGFHAIAMPQIGPGKVERFETDTRDIGRLRVTGNPDDIYRFRTPSLRNVALTAPYGHDGAYATLEAVVRHHLDPVAALFSYDISQAVLPALESATEWDTAVLADAREIAAIAEANELAPMALSNAEVSQLIAFLNALTDPMAPAGRLGVPDSVPSGLPVDR